MDRRIFLSGILAFSTASLLPNVKEAFGKDTLENVVKKLQPYDKLIRDINDRLRSALEANMFEYNDNITRKSVVRSINSDLGYMRDHDPQYGKLQWEVQCDKRNNTMEVINAHDQVVDLWFRPDDKLPWLQLRASTSKILADKTCHPDKNLLTSFI